jgi:hypothetical protein
LPLTRVELGQKLAEKYARLLPRISGEQQRRTRGEQEIIVRYEPERALETLPHLLRRSIDRERLLTLMEAVFDETKLGKIKPTPEQISTFEKIRGVLKTKPETSRLRGEVQNGRCNAPRQTNGIKRYGITH